MNPLVVIPASELQDLIRSCITSEISSLITSLQKPPEKKELIYRTKKYVRNLLHISYPTIDKYAEAGVLQRTYIGRRVLFEEEALRLAIPKLKALIKGGLTTV